MRTDTAKSIVALILTGIGSALVVGFRTRDDATPALAGTNAASAGTASGTTATGQSTAKYADGTWTGAAVAEPWGDFQVQVVIASGKIADVAVVEAPQDRHSERINSQAVPILAEATLATQSAAVDTVSGATWTTDSYEASLQSALDDAAAATHAS
jgi:uncharacterized protein with FMN-binding domain